MCLKNGMMAVEEDKSMNRVYVLGIVTVLVCGVVFLSIAPNATAGKKNQCTTIQSGLLKTSAGEVITPGFDQWGYNYQAQLFNGKYCDAYRNAAWCQPYKEDNLSMKWNEAWLSNMDCTGDGLLDRHYGLPSYRGSGAWLTNHQSGEYELDGQTETWNYFVKIVAAPADATLSGGVWYSAQGAEIGPSIWGEFAIVQEIYNDTGSSDHGVLYKSPAAPGFGKYKP